jgi:hypothetical protein
MIEQHDIYVKAAQSLKNWYMENRHKKPMQFYWDAVTKSSLGRFISENSKS